MRVAVIGGTGGMGRALARQLSKNNEVIIGSRDPSRALAAAEGIRGAVGMDYHAASKAADVVIFAIPYLAIGSASELASDLSGKLVISMINPLKQQGDLLQYAPRGLSAAEELAGLLPESRVVTAFNNVPAGFLRRDVVPRVDILVAADSKETYEKAAELIRGIEGMRPLYAGPLSQAGIVESITPLVLNLARLNGTGSLATRFVSWKG